MCESFFQEYYIHQDRLNNAGGPSSRAMQQSVRAFFPEKMSIAELNQKCSLTLPSKVQDIEAWLNSLAKRNGWSDLWEAAQKLDLPCEKMLLSPINLISNTIPKEDRDILQAALILARCNDHYFIPDSPLILTQNRLNRSVLLTKINLKQFYGMD